MRAVVRTAEFKRDYKRAKKRGLPIQELKDVVAMLANDEELPERMANHPLNGQLRGFWECHIRPDWLLIYKLTSNNELILTLSRTGSHADLFRR